RRPHRSRARRCSSPCRRAVARAAARDCPGVRAEAPGEGSKPPQLQRSARAPTARRRAPRRTRTRTPRRTPLRARADGGRRGWRRAAPWCLEVSGSLRSLPRLDVELGLQSPFGIADAQLDVLGLGALLELQGRAALVVAVVGTLAGEEGDELVV